MPEFVPHFLQQPPPAQSPVPGVPSEAAGQGETGEQAAQAGEARTETGASRAMALGGGGGLTFTEAGVVTLPQWHVSLMSESGTAAEIYSVVQ